MGTKLSATISETGIAGYLGIQLLQDEAPVGTPLAVVESATIPGRYSATMAGDAGYYEGALLFEVPPADPVPLATIPEFYWSGTTIIPASRFNAAADAVLLPSIPADWITAAGLAADAVAEIQAGLSTFDGDLSPVTDAIAALPTPLDAATTEEAAAAALTAYTVPTLAQVQAAGFTTTRDNALLAESRRKRIDYAASTLTLYAQDGTTPLQVFALRDIDGNPATTAQAAVDRVPQ